jgi:hypothetical protein
LTECLEDKPSKQHQRFTLLFKKPKEEVISQSMAIESYIIVAEISMKIGMTLRKKSEPGRTLG